MMKNESQIRLILVVMGLTALVLLGVSGRADAVPFCGPGAHWLDTCTSDTDSFPSIATIGIDTDFDNVADLSVVLSGPTTIFRGDPIDTPDPLDPGHFNQIDTEIVSLNLTGGGFTLIAGDGLGNLVNNGPLFSPGVIVEQAGDPTLADSFFDVFFELQGTPFGPLRNKDPLRIAAVIDRVPPIGFDYVHSIPGPIGLFDAGDIERLRLVNAVHTPVPEPSTLLLLGSGLAGLVGFGRKKLFKKA